MSGSSRRTVAQKVAWSTCLTLDLIVSRERAALSWLHLRNATMLRVLSVSRLARSHKVGRRLVLGSIRSFTHRSRRSDPHLPKDYVTEQGPEEESMAAEEIEAIDCDLLLVKPAAN